MRRNTLAWALALMLLAFLVAGLVRLFDLRQAGGDLHPPYSSLRSDPLGVKALYLALDDLRLETRRNYRPWRWVQPVPQATWFMVGVDRVQFQEEWGDHYQTIEGLVQNGGRLVIAFQAELLPPSVKWQHIWRKATQGQGEKDEPRRPLDERWGFQFAHQPLPKDDEENYRPATAQRAGAPASWPETLAWRSALGFTNVAPEWQVLYRVGTQGVLMERKLGQGTMVLMSDSYLVSNEALRFQRVPALLSWLVGQPAVVVFDEAHLGVVEEPGMGSLLRQYRLQGVAAAALLLALLYLWQNSFPLAPAPPTVTDAEADCVQGRDALMGFVNLLRRGFPPRRLLRVCFEHWKDTAGRNTSAAVVAAMEARVEGFEQTAARFARPVQVYHELAQLAAPKRRRPPPSSTS